MSGQLTMTTNGRRVGFGPLQADTCSQVCYSSHPSPLPTWVTCGTPACTSAELESTLFSTTGSGLIPCEEKASHKLLMVVKMSIFASNLSWIKEAPKSSLESSYSWSIVFQHVFWRERGRGLLKPGSIRWHPCYGKSRVETCRDR